MKKTILQLLLLICSTTPLVWAQTDSSMMDSQTEKILSFIYKLPPLEELISKAIDQSSLIKSRDALVRVKENELARIKNDWLNILSFKGNVGYGNSFIDVNQSNLANGINSNVNTVLFNVGVGINLSPSYWVERKHELDIRKSYVEYEQAMQQEANQAVKQSITDLYINIEYYRDIFLASLAGYEANRITIRLAEKKFVEGEIEISIYNDIILKHIKLQLEIEGYKQNLKKSYYELIYLIGDGLN